MAAITAAELLLGVELADARRRSGRKGYVEAVISTIPIEDYDLDVARAHAALLGRTTRSGRSRSPYELVIAATALARDRIVVTADAGGFADLPGVVVRSLPRAPER